MSLIEYEKSNTWLHIVEDILGDSADIKNRLEQANLDYVCWDYSNLEEVFSYQELKLLFKSIQDNVADCSLRLYHGCRLFDGQNPLEQGLQPSSADGIKEDLLKLVEHDEVLRIHAAEIKALMASPFYQEQERCRNQQVWFCLTMKEMINDGGVYVAFGSEFRLLLLNGVNEELKNRLFYYGKPSVVAVDLPINPFLSSTLDLIPKFLFSLWVHNVLNLNDDDKPDGYACYIKEAVPAKFVKEIIHPTKVYDQYNSEARWYEWSEIYKVLNE